ncbi:Polyphenol oxidase [Abeliophyllum distichum]|uniref:Polyphenol oxidase n=1 Tax=Abeliophyllum distichum TaxID=126358 RepID=A0ABD1QKF7_9LAMI
MAAFLFSWSIATTPLAKQSQFVLHEKRNNRLLVSCDQNQTDSKISIENSDEKIERRNLLLGMGGLYGASNLLSVSPAFATPIAAPDFAKCSRGTNLNTGQPLDVNCCPPLSTEIIDYKLPPVTKMRFRPAAHLATEEYIAKFEKAVELMKSLPADDPRNFMQQANVHCAYCNLTYEQVGDSDLRIQIHNCWHFFPWHRWYLYFYERILGKLIGDHTFGLPFWNWDNPEGMVIPAMFSNSSSPLYNSRRNVNHLPPATADLAYSGKDAKHPSKIIPHNLTLMYREMIRHARHLEDFYGAKYSTGSKPNPGPGTVERGSHTAMHSWVGEATRTGEDMGNFYSSGRDTLFFGHHANVDRLWTVWQDLRGSKSKHFTDTDWLNTNFLFYDENAQLVRVKVADTLDNIKMGYDFQKVDIPWQKNKPKARVKKSKVASTSGAPSADSVFPVKLDKVVKVLVPRPKKSRSKKDKENEEELLTIEGIEVDTAEFVKFDVFVNDEDDDPYVLDKAEYAGCFSQLPHKNSSRVNTKIRLGLTELLEDLDCEDDEYILVTLVPKAGGEEITIGGIKIIYVS